MYKQVVRPLLFRLPADSIHESTVTWSSKASRSPLLRSAAKGIYHYQHPSLEQKILGLHFRNPVGLAAGFDKNGTLLPIMESLGIGFVEVGSITAEPSSGNPRPRSFRLKKDCSLINRMGLNNDGAATIMKRLENLKSEIPIGVNIAKTHNPDIVGEKALEDYRESYRLAKERADYITVNISCPNTREGKTFEDPENLNRLLERITSGEDATSPPLFVKLSADLSRSQLKELIDVCSSHSVNGYVATNTSTVREGLSTPADTLERIGKGGLSGRAIRAKSTDVIRHIFELTNGNRPIIGVGGIFSAEDALEKIEAGADLIQVYTGLIYEGPALIRKINRGLAEYLEKKGLDHLYQIRSN
ncbi:MAG: quinone-dependent dihydroorotate dehydrogenase [Balneolaceae bacterium]